MRRMWSRALVGLIVGAMSVVATAGSSYAGTRKVEAESSYTSLPTGWSTNTSSNASNGQFVDSGSLGTGHPISFAFSTTDPATVELRGIWYPWVVTFNARVDGGSWRSCTPPTPTYGEFKRLLCDAPFEVNTAGSHTFSVDFVSGNTLGVDYLQITEVVPPPTTTTTSTSTTTSTTTTTVPDTACDWEWGGVQEVQPAACEQEESMSLSSSSRPDRGGSSGVPALVGMALLGMAALGTLRAAGRRRT